MSYSNGYLSFGTKNATSKRSNCDFTVTLLDMTNEMKLGVRGASVVGVSFPNNFENIYDGNNSIALELDDSVLLTPVIDKVLTNGALRFSYKHTNDSDYTYITVTVADGSFRDATEFMSTYGASIHSQFDSYNLTGLRFSVKTGTQVLELTNTTDDYQVIFHPREPITGLVNIASVIGFDMLQPVTVPATTVLSASRSTSATTITIPKGHYDIDSLISNITEQLDQLTTGSWTIEEQDEFVNPRLKISYDSSVTDAIVIYNSDFGTTMADELGIETTTIAPGGGTVLEIEHVPNLFGPMTVQLKSEILTGHNTVDGDGSKISIAKNIPINVGYRDLVVMTDTSDTPDITFPSLRVFTNIDISLTRFDNTPLDIGTGEVEVFIKLFI